MKKTVFIAILTSLIAFSGCRTTRMAKLEKTNDFDELYKGAIAYYEQGKYSRAQLLFEKISPFYRGTVEAEKVQFYWAYSLYYQGLYQLSSFRFKTFYQTYGRSEYAEESEYLSAYALFKDAPQANLDQTSSEEAVIAMQNFLNRWPASQYYTEANDIIDELQVRFETKAYQKAKLYHRLTSGLSYRNYLEAAIITFDAFKNDFPDSNYIEELLYLSVETEFKLADNSITSKKKERLTQTVAYYNEFIEKYPISEYTAKVTDYYKQSIKQLNDINKSL
ncbi:MAG: outer membrane protein assembly factor BamD [Roseivirga sp.]|jgi:outer membrane protein assembly factor BamD